ncbi:zinc finger protein 574-like [Folsomia candida]|uniref:zinc finger protein 574-like n=1 Tax=Folsomia candida TaxID=158441 RepID=UPI0016051D05|nr:zinc finger protein 574-like [Folsomia candida]
MNYDVEAPLPREKIPCKICGIKLSRKDIFHRHMRTIHRDISPGDIAAASKGTDRLVPPQFPCPQCDQSFTLLWNLRRHMRSVHEILVPFQRKCPNGPQLCPSLNVMQKHMAQCHDVPVPTKEDLSSCAICAKIFASQANQRRHVELFHFLDKTSCPYGCDVKIDSEADWVSHLERCDSPKMIKKSKILINLCNVGLHDLENVRKLCDLCRRIKI